MDICLALGGGGSRGHAHIGVIRRLEQEGFHIRAVAGTSAGGIVAAVYAAGYTPDQMETIFSHLDQSELFGRLALEGPGLLGLSGASKVLEDLLGRRTFADLCIPCAMPAVDVKSGREVILDQGRVVDAVLATIALPGIFPPREIGDYQLVDGGVLDPVPVSVARLLMPDLPVVAVILSQEVEPAGNAVKIPLPALVPPPIVERITRMRVAQAFTIFLQAVDAAQRMLAGLRLQNDAPEVIIRPEVGGIGLLDTVDVHRVVRLGEKAVEAALPDLYRATTWPNRVRRKYFRKRSKEMPAHKVV
jgi:NTE family protein